MNSKGDTSNLNSNLKAFLAYINQKRKTENDFIELLDREVKKAKANLEWRREYMTLYIKYHEKMEEGRAKGDMQRLISQVRKKVDKGISAVKAADMLEEAPELVGQIMELIYKCPKMSDGQIYEELKK